MDKKLELLFEDLEANAMDNYSYKYDIKEANQIIRKHFETLIMRKVVRQSEQLPTYLPKVNRVEVIDQKGRNYVNWKPTNKTKISLQDDGKTLKVFISG